MSLALVLAASCALAGQDALGVWREYRELCAQDLWPGFEPCGTPVMLFDGASTWLCGHPDPPAEFAAVEGEPAIRAFAGQHAEARANTSIVLAGVPTATYLVNKGGRDARELAAGVLHEAFHVFQRAHHPEWSANEADLFLYPAADGELLAARREETEALRRALEQDEGRGWAARACELRRERAERMTAGVAYERASELNEGLAQYVQYRALGRTTGELAADGYAPELVRDRAYDTGEAWALLLERFAPGWPAELAESHGSLDQLLASKLAGETPTAFTDEERAALRTRALADAAELEKRRAEELRAFESAPGWRLEVVSAAEPLAIQNFDPLNVTLVAPDRVLHKRWMKLGHASGSVELLDRTGLTEAAGQHPLFAGVKRLLVTGLPEEPRVEAGDGAVTLSAPGVTLSFRSATLEKSAQTFRIVLAR